MKLDRTIAIVRSLIQRQANEIAMLTDPHNHFNMEQTLLELFVLKSILIQDRLIELECELARERLEALAKTRQERLNKDLELLKPKKLA